MSDEPYTYTVMPGYVVDVTWEEDEPPEEATNYCFTYERGYWKVVVHVTPDNLSVAETEKVVLLVFPVETERLEDHGYIATHAYTVFPVEEGQQVSEISILPDRRNHEGQLTDCDRLVLELNDDGGCTLNHYFCLFFMHLKKDGDFIDGIFG